jgi:hypothetical protein
MGDEGENANQITAKHGVPSTSCNQNMDRLTTKVNEPPVS